MFKAWREGRAPSTPGSLVPLSSWGRGQETSPILFQAFPRDWPVLGDLLPCFPKLLGPPNSVKHLFKTGIGKLSHLF